MKSILTLALISTLFVSCSQKESNNERMFEKTNPSFSSYVKQFEEKNNVKIKDLPLNFANDSLEKELVVNHQFGRCYTYLDGRKEVVFNKTYFSVVDETTKKDQVERLLKLCTQS